jgi:thiol-disulfide isomerase/thioredoxin
MKVIKIGATWCQGCKIMGPRWKEIEVENPWLVTEFYDFDQNKEIVSKYNITAMPSFVFLDKDNNEILRLSGEVDKIKLIEVINQNKDK